MNKILDYRAIRYLVGGSISTLIPIITLFILKEYVGLYYLTSSTIACSVGILTSFTIQKFWVFGDKRKEIVGRQFVVFLIFALINISINGAMMFLLVEKIGLWYMLSQLITVAIIAMWNFFLYRYLIFA